MLESRSYKIEDFEWICEKDIINKNGSRLEKKGLVKHIGNFKRAYKDNGAITQIYQIHPGLLVQITHPFNGPQMTISGYFTGEDVPSLAKELIGFEITEIKENRKGGIK